MSFVNWQLDLAEGSLSASDKTPFLIFETSVKNLSHNFSVDERQIDNLAATGRRAWKTKGIDREAVWPPHLELALIEGLTRYQRKDFRPMRDGRCVKRNKFLSDFIHDATGERRTPRQISSRLQCIKDNCVSTSLLELISPPELEWTPPPPLVRKPRRDHATKRLPPQDSTQASPPLRPKTRRRVTKSETVEGTPTPLPQELFFNTPLLVDVLLDKNSQSTSPPVASLIPLSQHQPQSICLVSSSSVVPSALQFPGGTAPLLGAVSKIQINSPCPLLSRSRMFVFLNGFREPVYSEDATLLCDAFPLNGSEWTYTTSLVSGYWHTLCNTDPTQYIVEQHIVPLCPFSSSGSSSLSSGPTPGGIVIVSYHFRVNNPVVEEPLALHFDYPAAPLQRLHESVFGHDGRMDFPGGRHQWFDHGLTQLGHSGEYLPHSSYAAAVDFSSLNNQPGHYHQRVSDHSSPRQTGPFDFPSDPSSACPEPQIIFPPQSHGPFDFPDTMEQSGQDPSFSQLHQIAGGAAHEPWSTVHGHHNISFGHGSFHIDGQYL